jgi:lactoylglutathione lyase
MRYLHSMLRVSDPDATIAFFKLLGLEERRRREVPEGRYTLIFLGVPGDEGGEVELTHNWDETGYSGGRNFGHLAFEVDDIYKTARGSRPRESPSTVRRATAEWPSSARPTRFRSSCCKRVAGSSRPSPGCPCPTAENGDG